MTGYTAVALPNYIRGEVERDRAQHDRARGDDAQSFMRRMTRRPLVLARWHLRAQLHARKRHDGTKSWRRPRDRDDRRYRDQSPPIAVDTDADSRALGVARDSVSCGSATTAALVAVRRQAERASWKKGPRRTSRFASRRRCGRSRPAQNVRDPLEHVDRDRFPVEVARSVIERRFAGDEHLGRRGLCRVGRARGDDLQRHAVLVRRREREAR